MADTRLERALRDRLREDGRAFVPYVTGGLPGVDVDLLRAIEAKGADAIEIGIPFSDPVMDGEVIQEASRRALESGITPFTARNAISLVKEARLSIPVVLMTYLNPVYRMGIGEFGGRCREAGVAGVIIPDLPVDEGEDWSALWRETFDLPTIYLAAPGTGDERLRRIAAASSGFLYCVSGYGVTGERRTLSDTSRELVEALRPLTKLPLLVGVGISKPEHASEACAFADGVIVGSALVGKLLDGGPDAAVATAAEFREAIPRGGSQT